MDPAEDPGLLTPEQLVDYPLRRATRGYAVAEVDALLDALAAQTERLLAEASAARAMEQDARSQLDGLREELREARSAAERSVAAAREAAEAVLADARSEAARIVAAGREEVAAAHEEQQRRVRAEEADLVRRRRAVQDHVDQLRQFAQDHRARLVQHLQHELARLEEVHVPQAPDAPDLGRDPLLDEPLLPEVPESARPPADGTPDPVADEQPSGGWVDPVDSAPWAARSDQQAGGPTQPRGGPQDGQTDAGQDSGPDGAVFDEALFGES